MGIQSTALGKSTPQDQTALTPRAIWKKTAGVFSGDIFILPKKGNFLLGEKDFSVSRLLPSTVKGKTIPPHPITMHGVAWDYDLRIPIAFFDPSNQWIKPNQYRNMATQQDIASTMSHILNIPAPARNPGRVLFEALRVNPKLKLPRAILVFVQDQAGVEYYKAHPGAAPFYEKIMKSGANFVNASVSHVDVETSVGHMAVGSGAWPSEHGVSGNNFFHLGMWQQIKAFTIPISASKKENLVGNPSLFFTPTVADIWVTATSGKAKVFSQVYAPRAAIGMAGHGATFIHGLKTHVVWMDESDNHGESYMTDERIYSLPNSHRGKSVRSFAESLTKETSGRWKGHSLFTPDGKLDGDMVKASPALSDFEGTIAVEAIKELQIGTDDVTDLVFINTKATDACGHRFGFESDECGEVLTASDSAAKKIFDQIHLQSSGEFIAILTADHGAAPLPEVSGKTRFSFDALTKDLNTKFDRRDNQIDVIKALTSSQIYVNEAELAASGFKLEDMVKFLKSYKVTLTSKYNSLADEWIKRGTPKEQLFFEDVVISDSL
jgi:hypothetical protein